VSQKTTVIRRQQHTEDNCHKKTTPHRRQLS